MSLGKSFPEFQSHEFMLTSLIKAQKTPPADLHQNGLNLKNLKC